MINSNVFLVTMQGQRLVERNASDEWCNALCVIVPLLYFHSAEQSLDHNVSLLVEIFHSLGPKSKSCMYCT